MKRWDKIVDGKYINGGLSNFRRLKKIKNKCMILWCGWEKILFLVVIDIFRIRKLFRFYVFWSYKELMDCLYKVI